MPGLGDPTGTRLVAFSLDEIQRLPFSMRNEKLAAFHAAPADPAEALLQALAGWISGDPKVDLADFSDDLDEVVTAVLEALGCVVERPANTGDHQ